MRPVHTALAWPIAAAFSLSPLAASANIDIVFDYSYDSAGFFGSTQRNLLEAAATVFESRITDNLGAIVGDGSAGLNFQLSFLNPGDGSNVTLSNANIAAGQFVVYVGAYNLGAGSTLGIGGPGGFSYTSSSPAAAATVARGQTGYLTPGNNNDTDFGAWGGFLSFNTQSNWYFDADPGSLESFSGSDFYSVALHELAHALGLGTAESWAAKVTGSTFNGLYSGIRTLSADGGHWAEGTMSTIDGLGSFEAMMDPTLTVGTRKQVTDLDWNGLRDVGWQVTAVPEPAPAALLLAGLLALAFKQRAQRRR